MESSLKELIQKATINGILTESNREFIYLKGREQGILENELNIYIEAYLKENATNVKSNDFNTTSFVLKNTDWVDKLSYLFGLGILLSGLFPWIESHVSSSYGNFNSKYSVGGLGYSIPFGLCALYLVYNLKFKPFRKYYGLGISAITFLIALSYETNYSNSIGGYSASAGTNAGVGLIIMLFMGLLYAGINFTDTIKKILTRNAILKQQPISFSNELLVSLIEPLYIITVLIIWIFYFDFSESEKKIYLLLVFFLTLGAFIYRKKISIETIFLVLMSLITLDTLLDFFDIYQLLGINREISNQLVMRFGSEYAGNGELEFFRSYMSGYSNVFLDKSLINIEIIIANIKNASNFVSLIIIAYKLIEIIQKFIKSDFVFKIYKIFTKHYKKLIWILIIMLFTNISGLFYITFKNKSDFQNEIEKQEKQSQVNKVDFQEIFKDFTSDDNQSIIITVGYINDTPVTVKHNENSKVITLVKIIGSKKFTEAINGATRYEESFEEIINGQVEGRYDFLSEGGGDYIIYKDIEGNKLEFSFQNTQESID